MNHKYLSKNQISLAGEFAVLSQLALRGFDANMTLGNTKGVDILLSHPETKTMNRLEVKTHFDNRPYISKEFGYIEAHWKIGEKTEEATDKLLFYCFVSIAQTTEAFNFYIIPSQIVAQFAKESHLHWLRTDTRRMNTSLRSFMLGKRGEKYSINMPIAEDYLNKWELLR